MRRTLIFFVWVFVLIQFIRVDYENPESQPENDLIAIENPPEAVASILKNSCYDCHSNKTQWPWYSQIAPVSWLVEHHVSEGRRHFNFSEWHEMDRRHKDRFVEEAEYELNEGDMPLPMYTWMHMGTSLSKEDQKVMIEWLNSL